MSDPTDAEAEAEVAQAELARCEPAQAAAGGDAGEHDDAHQQPAWSGIVEAPTPEPGQTARHRFPH